MDITVEGLWNDIEESVLSAYPNKSYDYYVALGEKGEWVFELLLKELGVIYQTTRSKHVVDYIVNGTYGIELKTTTMMKINMHRGKDTVKNKYTYCIINDLEPITVVLWIDLKNLKIMAYYKPRFKSFVVSSMKSLDELCKEFNREYVYSEFMRRWEEEWS